VIVNLDPGRYLFHYTNRLGFDGILSAHRLRLSPYEKMRDPLENHRWRFTFFGGSGPVDDAAIVREAEAQDTFEQMANDRIKKGCHLLSLTADAEPSPGSEHEFFHRGWARARLWEQYAERHRGMCLVFDRERLTRCFAESALARSGSGGLYHRPVTYSDNGLRKPIVDKNALEAEPGYFDRYIATHHEALFFRKTLDWETEHEYRFVVVSQTADPPCTPLSIDYGDALTHVVAGQCLGGRERPAFEARCRQVGAEPLRVKWKNYRVGLVPLA